MSGVSSVTFDGDYTGLLPFIVFAVNPPICHSIEGAEVGLAAVRVYQGSNLLVSGGYYKPNDSGDSTDSMIVQTGLLDVTDPLGQRFAERIVVACVPEDERVIVHYNLSFSSPLYEKHVEWVNEARSLGFEVVVTPNGERAQESAVCIGNGSMFSSLHWLDDKTETWADHIVIASRSPLSDFEQRLVQGACKGIDVRKLIDEFAKMLFGNPGDALKQLGGYSLVALLIEGDNLIVYGRDMDLPWIGDTCASIASELGIALFDAGRINEPDDSGRPFSDYAIYPIWRILPSNWKRLV